MPPRRPTRCAAAAALVATCRWASMGMSVRAAACTPLPLHAALLAQEQEAQDSVSSAALPVGQVVAREASEGRGRACTAYTRPPHHMLP